MVKLTLTERYLFRNFERWLLKFGRRGKDGVFGRTIKCDRGDYDFYFREQKHTFGAVEFATLECARIGFPEERQMLGLFTALIEYLMYHPAIDLIVVEAVGPDWLKSKLLECGWVMHPKRNNSFMRVTYSVSAHSLPEVTLDKEYYLDLLTDPFGHFREEPAFIQEYVARNAPEVNDIEVAAARRKWDEVFERRLPRPKGRKRAEGLSA